MTEIQQFAELIRRKDSGDQQHGVCPKDTGLVDLTGRDEKVLSKDGKLCGCAGCQQILWASLKKLPVGKYRQTGRASGFIASGVGNRVQIRAKHSFGRRCPLDFGNDVDACLSRLPESFQKRPSLSWPERLFLKLFFNLKF